MLVISEQEIRQHGPGNALAVCWRQWRTERALSRRGVRFRDTDLDDCAAAYAAMTEAEFDAINGRQDWANWRTIPRALSGHVPDRPLTVLDLGCGSGSSTKVLAFYCPAGSHIMGYEMMEHLLAAARRRSYSHRSGRPATVEFICQGVTETWRDPAGTPIPEGSVDLVNASGVVGHHLDAILVRPLIAQLQNVLGPDGVALLDVGPALPAAVLTPMMKEAGFRVLGHYRSFFLDPTGEVAYRRQRAGG
jgi:SAM-dependent methyltransferase